MHHYSPRWECQVVDPAWTDYVRTSDFYQPLGSGGSILRGLGREQSNALTQCVLERGSRCIANKSTKTSRYNG